MPDPLRSRAVLVGTAEYRDPAFPRLPAAANSLAGMRAVLTDPALCGWPDGRVTVESDPSDWRALVRRTRAVARETEDVLLLYFVGHGVVLPNGELCLALADTEADDPDLTGLEYRRVRDLLRDSPAAAKIVILDCCYSGRAIEALSAASPGDAADTVADATDVRGVYTLTASDHTAHVVPLAEQAEVPTSFTGRFLGLVREGVRGGPAVLTLGDLYVHLRRRLAAEGLPAPNQRGTDTADRYPFSRNPAYRPEPASLVKPPPVPAARPRATVRPRTGAVAGLRGPWQAATGVPVLLDGRSAGATALAFAPGGGTLATGHADGTIHIWDAPGKPLRTLRPLSSASGAITALAFAPGGGWIAYGTSRAGVGLRPLAPGSPESWPLQTAEPGGPAVASLDFASDGRLLAGGFHGEGDHRAGQCALWEINLAGRPFPSTPVVLLPRWGTPDPRPGSPARPHTDEERVAVFRGARHILAVERMPRLASTVTWQFVDAVRWQNPGGTTRTLSTWGTVRSARFSPGADTLALIDDGFCRVWRWTGITFRDDPHAAFATPATSMAVGPDGWAAALWGPGVPLRVWNLETGSPIGAPLRDSARTRAVAFTPDGLSVAVAATATPVRLWRPA
ncbi:hypothetical protein DZF91_29250 [Actinomadura logoneensis]|uniref:Peptidase C14 caspase domain-containing protein n=1 Tax=Actinomadura logoneensis TaxID=2293572 RepID=A0A372JDQ0_9ACTN|nr:caspase family protein [Actinomadura logoneensis]RFU38143.1 hypothetical protein DZF91_29250 [Actinomadura logoneensis]